jgi:hypothetical protein
VLFDQVAIGATKLVGSDTEISVAEAGQKTAVIELNQSMDDEQTVSAVHRSDPVSVTSTC